MPTAARRARWMEYERLDALTPAERNPKGHDLPGLGQSMERLGYTEPIMVDERTSRLVSGHGRLQRLTADKAAGKPPPEGIEVDDDGEWLVPVAHGWASANDVEANAALIAANQLTIVGGWSDSATLLDLLTEVEPVGFDGVGFTTDDFAAMLAERVVPDFQPTDGLQPRLDQRNPITCPACQHEFVPR